METNNMIELRRRMTNSPTYTRLTTEDEIDEVPDLIESPINIVLVPKKKSTFCAKFCFFFSLSGVIFLSSISFLLHKDNLYVKINSKTESQKLEIADSVSEAALMYIGVMIIYAYYWLSAIGRNNIVQNEAYSRTND